MLATLSSGADARKKSGRREEGLGFATKSHLVSKLSRLPKGIKDRLKTLGLPLSCKRHATTVSAYAPTMTKADVVIDTFYEDLEPLISATPRTNSTSLGTDHQTWEGVIGTEGNCNSNDLLL